MGFAGKHTPPSGKSADEEEEEEKLREGKSTLGRCMYVHMEVQVVRLLCF